MTNLIRVKVNLRENSKNEKTYLKNRVRKDLTNLKKRPILKINIQPKANT